MSDPLQASYSMWLNLESVWFQNQIAGYKLLSKKINPKWRHGCVVFGRDFSNPILKIIKLFPSFHELLSKNSQNTDQHSHPQLQFKEYDSCCFLLFPQQRTLAQNDKFSFGKIWEGKVESFTRLQQSLLEV